MCRWMAYLGDPVLAEGLVFRPVHSIIDQSLHAELTGVTTNGDGFGIGWYGDRPVPSIYKGTHPAWNDGNLREVAAKHSHPTAVRACPSIERDAGPAQQLPPLPARPVAMDAQRVARQFQRGPAGFVDGGGSDAVCAARRVDRLRGPLFPGPDLRPDR